ncbi:MAG: membrane protein insertase YidC [Acetobacteraceae bacterium]|nr:membrane protein insertase YidC [Acetobacteraceae bacterium]
MDQKRLFLAIALSIAILFGFQMLLPKPIQVPQDPAVASTQAGAPTVRPATPTEVASAVPKAVPRLKIAAPRLTGSVSLLGARIDDVVLTEYRETIDPKSPNVRILEPRSEAQPYYVQFGWSAPPDSKIIVPDNATIWTGAGEIGPGKTGKLTWDNGAGLMFGIEIGLDVDFMFTIKQTVHNAAGAPAQLFPWARIRRDYAPEVSGYYVLHEGMIGVLDGRLKEVTYASAKSDGEKKGGIALESTGAGGWMGITDKYWLIALIPDQTASLATSFRHVKEAGSDRYQVDFASKDPSVVAPGGDTSLTTKLFAGAKIVKLLAHYEQAEKIPNFDKAVDWGWFELLTKPIFYAIDWLYSVLGNFGVAILVFTAFVKALFFPLANKSYRSMSKMKLLGPKMTELRETFKDQPAELQKGMMELYKREKVNPASGCLPLLIQIPVFFSLYKVIFVTIEMRQAPFFGWIRDLSAVDPTNIFNLFGLIPYDPGVLSPYLHMGIWPLIMGITMFLQQKLNPPPPDPMQAKLFQFMPIMFTFMMAGFPAGLVIYWSWNNTLTMAQQWYIMRQTSLSKPGASLTKPGTKS